jgi:hypothetical protein
MINLIERHVNYMDHKLFFSFARRSYLSNPIILVQIPTELTVSCSVSLMSCRATQIMRRPSSNLLQRYFSIQIFLILLAVKWRYWQATIPWKRQPTRWRVTRVHCRRPRGHQNRFKKKRRGGESWGSRCRIRNSSCCWLFPCDGWIVVVLDIGSFTRHRIIKVSGASRTCAHLGSWISWILLILLFLCHKILTQKFNSIVFIDRSGIWKERFEIVVLGVFV